MRYIEPECWLALKARIETLATDPAMPVFEPDATVTPPVVSGQPAPFILTSDIRNPNSRLGIDPKLVGRSGILMLAVHWPISRPVTHAQLMQIGGTISAHFPVDLRMRVGSTCLRVTTAPDVSQPYRDGADRVTIVRVPWSTV